MFEFGAVLKISSSKSVVILDSTIDDLGSITHIAEHRVSRTYRTQSYIKDDSVFRSG